MSEQFDSDGCDCAELCSMGPTCPGGMLSGLPGSGCWREQGVQSGSGDVFAQLRTLGSAPYSIEAYWPGDDRARAVQRVHNHSPYRPVCNERVVDGQFRGACLNDDGSDR